MYPLFKEILPLQRDSEVPVYVQISNRLTLLITSGKLASGDRIPSSRAMAEGLGVNRRTISLAYEELMAQGYIETRPASGTFVAGHLPSVQPRGISSEREVHPISTGFDYEVRTQLHTPVIQHSPGLVVDEGLPDLRLSPTDEIRRTFNNFLTRSTSLQHWSYGSPAGDARLREQLVAYLRQTRGIRLDVENLMITRGSQMGLYLATQLLTDFEKNSKVAVGRLNYNTANLTIRHAGAELITLPIDREGIDTEYLKTVCRQDGLRAVYVTPHHHHPTTVTLSAERRLHLMELASKYRFAIIEDDYDYDFHYARTPLLPLASIDLASVIYIGGFSKIISPALRIGFLVGPKQLVKDAIFLRRIIDRQGDALMERTVAQMLANGDIQRHCKKALRVYHERRTTFGQHLKTLGPLLNYQTPEGGMAYWVGLPKHLSWQTVRQRLAERSVKIPDWENYDPFKDGHNHLRLGFASLNSQEMEEVFAKIKETID